MKRGRKPGWRMDNAVRFLRQGGNPNYMAAAVARLYMQHVRAHEGRRVSHKEAIRWAMDAMMEQFPSGLPKAQISTVITAGIPCATTEVPTPETPRETPDWKVVVEMVRKNRVR